VVVGVGSADVLVFLASRSRHTAWLGLGLLGVTMMILSYGLIRWLAQFNNLRLVPIFDLPIESGDVRWTGFALCALECQASELTHSVWLDPAQGLEWVDFWLDRGDIHLWGDAVHELLLWENALQEAQRRGARFAVVLVKGKDEVFNFPPPGVWHF
jgi:hypothetical protein